MKQAIQEAVHRRRAEALYAGGQLLPSGQDGGGRPGVRHQADREEAPPLRGGPRPRHPTEGGDHSGPLSTSRWPYCEKIGGQARAMVVTSSVRRAITLLLRNSGVSDRAQESIQGHRRLLRRARARCAYEANRGVSQRLLVQPDSGQNPRRPVPLPGLRRQVPDRLRRAAIAHNVRGQAVCLSVKAVQTLSRLNRAHPEEARRLRA